MNFNCISKTSKILLENLGGNMYTIVKANEQTEPNYCSINQIDITVDKTMNDKGAYSLNNDLNTKFYIASLSIIGLYIFSRVRTKSQQSENNPKNLLFLRPQRLVLFFRVLLLGLFVRIVLDFFCDFEISPPVLQVFFIYIDNTIF